MNTEFKVLESCPKCGHKNTSNSIECQADNCIEDLRIYPPSTAGMFTYVNRTDDTAYATFSYWDGLKELQFIGPGATYETDLKKVRELVVYENWRAVLVLDSPPLSRE